MPTELSISPLSLSSLPCLPSCSLPETWKHPPPKLLDATLLMNDIWHYFPRGLRSHSLDCVSPHPGSLNLNLECDECWSCPFKGPSSAWESASGSKWSFQVELPWNLAAPGSWAPSGHGNCSLPHHRSWSWCFLPGSTEQREFLMPASFPFPLIFQNMPEQISLALYYNLGPIFS